MLAKLTELNEPVWLCQDCYPQASTWTKPGPSFGPTSLNRSRDCQKANTNYPRHQVALAAIHIAQRERSLGGACLVTGGPGARADHEEPVRAGAPGSAGPGGDHRLWAPAALLGGRKVGVELAAEVG